jgi:hypothetical protein
MERGGKRFLITRTLRKKERDTALDLRGAIEFRLGKPKRRRGLAPLPPHSKGERDTALDCVA